MTQGEYRPIAAANVVQHADAKHYDRQWLIINGKRAWISEPAVLSRIDVSIRFGYLVLQAPGMLRLDIPMDVIEDDDSVRDTAKIGDQWVDIVDEGEVAAVWLTQHLGQAARLVKIHPEAGDINWPA